MISKEKIAEIIREETWLEVDSARVYGIEKAAEKVMQAIEAAEQSVQLTGDWNCKKCDALNGARRKTCRLCDLPRN